MSKDYQTPAQRLAFLNRPRRYPFVLALIALVLLAYFVAQLITSWGASSPLVSFVVGWSCGI